MIDFELKFLPRRYRKRVTGLLLARDQMARELGIIEGQKRAEQEAAKRLQQIRPDMMMSVQRLAESNAQLGTVMARLLDVKM